MSREELISKLKKFMVLCTNTFSIEYVNWDTGDKIKIAFKKGEYYLIDSNEGGTWIMNDNGKWFDVYEDRYKGIFDKNFVSGCSR